MIIKAILLYILLYINYSYHNMLLISHFQQNFIMDNLLYFIIQIKKREFN